MPRLLALALILAVPGIAWAESGLATYYTIASAKSEGTSGTLTANGEAYDEQAMTCALRSRSFGQQVRVCHKDNCIIVRQNDYGPGKAATKRGVIVDLTPKAYDALGCKRGTNSRGLRGESARWRCPDYESLGLARLRRGAPIWRGGSHEQVAQEGGGAD